MRTSPADELYELAKRLPETERRRLVAKLAHDLAVADRDAATAQREGGDAAPARVVMARKIRLGEDTGDFDREFWRRVGAQGRFEAAWEAVRDLVRWGKLDEHELRLQRSVVRIYRRPSPVPDPELRRAPQPRAGKASKRRP